MHYPEFRHKGWPIGSGMVESANKNSVEARGVWTRNALGTQQCQSHARLTQCRMPRPLEGNVAKGCSATSAATGASSDVSGGAADTRFAFCLRYLLSGVLSSISCRIWANISFYSLPTCIEGALSFCYAFGSCTCCHTIQFLSSFHRGPTPYCAESGKLFTSKIRRGACRSVLVWNASDAVQGPTAQTVLFGSVPPACLPQATNACSAAITSSACDNVPRFLSSFRSSSAEKRDVWR
jgi:hypothetical protein